MCVSPGRSSPRQRTGGEVVKKLELLTRLRKWIEKAEQYEYVKCIGMDVVCPNCRRWQGNCDIPGSFKDVGHDVYDVLACGNCGHESKWVFGPVWIPYPESEKQNEPS